MPRQRPQHTGATQHINPPHNSQPRPGGSQPPLPTAKLHPGMTAQPPCKRTRHNSFPTRPPPPQQRTWGTPILQLSRSGPSRERQRLATGKTVGTRDSGALTREPRQYSAWRWMACLRGSSRRHVGVRGCEARRPLGCCAPRRGHGVSTASPRYPTPTMVPRY